MGREPPPASNYTQQGYSGSRVMVSSRHLKNKYMSWGTRCIWVQVLVLAVAGCVILSSELNLSESGSLPWCSGDMDVYGTRFVVRIL